MPTGLQRQRDKARKAVLNPEEVAKLLAAARDDVLNGAYVAFPFLAGTRPSEQLGSAVGRPRLRGECCSVS
jgi:integrase